MPFFNAPHQCSMETLTAKLTGQDYLPAVAGNIARR